MSYLKKAFGKNIKSIRKLKNVTQERLAELVEIDQRQLARIEAGESFATAETIERISEKLEISIGQLFDIQNMDDDKMTLEVIGNYKENYKALIKVIEKIAQSSSKTEFIKLAANALEQRTAREQLKGLLLGLDLKQ